MVMGTGTDRRDPGPGAANADARDMESMGVKPISLHWSRPHRRMGAIRTDVMTEIPGTLSLSLSLS